MSFSIFNLRSFPGKVQTQFNLYKLLHAGALTDPTTRPYCQMSYTAVVYTPIHNVSAQRDSYAYQSKGSVEVASMSGVLPSNSVVALCIVQETAC